jgi:flagellar biosynthesis/type III secretory pathway protein FliH
MQALLTRSTFAHGYRHGYEAGYHEGNMDINMARQARTRFKQFKGLPLGYKHSFGPKKSFELGFALGLEAGYGDGYAGRTFRAIASLRTVGDSLKPANDAGDPGNTFFDRGLTLGYQDGFAASQAENGREGILPVDMRSIKCSFRAGKKAEAAAESSYCDGYRRGFVLGRSDRLDLSPEQVLLEASK